MRLKGKNGIKIEVSDFSSQWYLFGTVATQSAVDLLQIEFNRIAEIAKSGENTAVTALNSLASVQRHRSQFKNMHCNAKVVVNICY
jgi:hypothetical protein